MSSHYEAPVEARPLEKLLRDFSYSNGLNINQVFNDMLRFIIHGFSPGAPPLTDWRYTKEQNLVFYQMYSVWIQIMAKRIEFDGWYDVFGELYMTLIVSPSHAQSTGQFFTPSHVYDLMSTITLDKHEETRTTYDCAAGSGRLLLSG